MDYDLIIDRCHSCGRGISSDEFQGGEVFETPSRCLCAKCITPSQEIVRRRSDAPAGQGRGLFRTVPTSTAFLVIYLSIAAILALLIAGKAEFPKEKTSSKQDGSQSGHQIYTENKPSAEVPPTVEDEVSIYKRIRDNAIRLIEEKRYREAAMLIENYPSEQRSSIYWLERLAPLKDEALNLELAQATYLRLTAIYEELLRDGNTRGAVALLQSYPKEFAHTEWAKKISELLKSARTSEQEAIQKEKAEVTQAPYRDQQGKIVEEKGPPPTPPEPLEKGPLPHKEEKPPTPSEDLQPKEQELPDELKEKIDKAVKRGMVFLIKQQQSDGSFFCPYRRTYPMGATALPLFTLLACGAKRDADEISRSFDYLAKLPLERTYCVSLLLMALEAKYQPSKEQTKKSVKPFTAELLENFRTKASPRDKKLAEEALKWIIKSQLQNGYWTYRNVSPVTTTPERTGQAHAPAITGDGSNTQFAVLGLYAASRLGLDIPQETMERVARAFIDSQEKSGKSVESFPVPAADFPIAELRSAEKSVIEKRSKDGPQTVPLSELKGGRSWIMSARGWGYTPNIRSGSSMSMTAAGVCNLVIAKTLLESKSNYKPLSEKIDSAIRDGAAWISTNFGNFIRYFCGQFEGSDGWGEYYTLYAIERAGILTLCREFGEKNWFVEGAHAILPKQRPNGSWGGGVVDTCFALLFLTRAIVPIIEEETIYTGKDLFKNPARREK